MWIPGGCNPSVWIRSAWIRWIPWIAGERAMVSCAVEGRPEDALDRRGVVVLEVVLGHEGRGGGTTGAGGSDKT